MNSKLRKLFAPLVGNILECYDFALYATFAPIIASYFFPHNFSESLTLLIYTLSFFMRPIGAIIFGYIGDKYGRRKAFTLPLLLMAIFTLSIALIPSYQEVGIISPILLTVCRLGQGFCMGGEYGGALVFSLEHQRNKNLGFAAGLLGSSVLFGNFVANIVSFLFTLPVFSYYSWKIPFFLGAIVGVLGIWIRNTAKETPEFISNPNKLRIPLYIVLKQYPVSFIQGIVISGIGGLLGTFVYVYINFYLVNSLKWDINMSLGLNSFGLIIALIICPFAGLVSERYSHLKAFNICALLCLLTIIPALYFISTNQIFLVIFAMLVLSILTGTCWGIINLLLFSLFPTEVRYTGIAFSESIGRILFAAPVPIACNYLSNLNHFLFTPSSMVVITLILMLFILNGDLLLKLKINSIFIHKRN